MPLMNLGARCSPERDEGAEFGEGACGLPGEVAGPAFVELGCTAPLLCSQLIGHPDLISRLLLEALGVMGAEYLRSSRCGRLAESSPKCSLTILTSLHSGLQEESGQHHGGCAWRGDLLQVLLWQEVRAKRLWLWAGRRHAEHRQGGVTGHQARRVSMRALQPFPPVPSSGPQPLLVKRGRFWKPFMSRVSQSTRGGVRPSGGAGDPAGSETGQAPPYVECAACIFMGVRGGMGPKYYLV